MIDHSENPIRVTVGEGIMHEIHTPALLWTNRHRGRPPMERPMLASPDPHAQLEPLQLLSPRTAEAASLLYFCGVVVFGGDGTTKASPSLRLP